MGARFGGVVIKADPSPYSSLEVLEYFEQQNFRELSQDELNGFWYDTRKEDCFSIYKTPNGLWLINQSLAEVFFEQNSESFINEFYSYFNNPELIVAFNEYDTTSTYGFIIIEKGKLTRGRRAIRFDTTLDVGTPLPQEEKWMKAKTFTEYVDDRPVLCYQDPEDENRIYDKEGLTQVILHELTQEHFGFPTWDIHSFTTEEKFYTTAPPNVNELANKPIVKKESWLKRLFKLS